MADQLFLATLRSVRPAYRWRSRLDGVFYTFRCAYNTRRRLWHLDLRTSEGEALVLGIPILVGVSLLEPWRGLAGFPPGQIIAQDTTGQDRDPGRQDLRGVVRLIYRPEADVLAAEGTASEVR